ncbi:aldo/keto reductase [bacterium]|nr:aldo/keto reductase [bacterium]
MQYRQLGDSQLTVPAVVFGAWAAGGWMWGGIDDDEVVRAIQTGIDLGITCIDTAPIYGFGHSEELVGRAVAGRRREVLIATKCCLRWNVDAGQFYFQTRHHGATYRIHKYLGAESIIWECEQSLRRLNVDVIDLYQCHWEDPTTPLEETMEALLLLQKQGKIRAIGVSNFSADSIRKCKALADIASNQPRYNPLRRDSERDVLPVCRELSVGVLAYSPLEHGLLSDALTPERRFSGDDLRRTHPWAQPANRPRLIAALQEVRGVARQYGVSVAQAIINWVAGEPGITAAIVGARSEPQVRENAGALAFSLAPEHRARIRAIFENLGEPAKP